MKSALQIALLLLIAFTAINAGNTDCQFTESNQTSKPIVDFTLQLHKKIVARNGNKNIVFSPASILLALALVEAGSAGQTQTELKKVLAPTGYNGDVSLLYQSLQHHLKLQPTDAKLSIANSLYHSRRLTVKSEYLEKVRNCFETEVNSVEYAQTEQVRQQINQWVSNKTNAKIPQLIKPGVLSVDTVSVLVNAIYFKAAWAEQFYVDPTEIDFHPLGENTVQKVKFLHKSGTFYFAEDDDLQLVEIPYKDIPVSMYIIKAKANNTGIQAVEPRITAEKLIQLARSRQEKRVTVKIPPFEIRLGTGLTNILKEIGLVNMFSTTADFSRMTAGRISVDDVVHEAYIKVDQNGTEAAAATAVVSGTRRLDTDTRPIIQFKADHPFLFSIVHQQTKTALFHGKVNSVKAEN